MAFQAKFTLARGKNNPAQVAVAAGAAEAQSDTMSLNVDVTAMTKGDVLIQLEAIRAKIHAGKWPPL